MPSQGPMPNPTAAYQKIQLLLPNDLFEFAGELANSLQRPGQTVTRQQAIRETLAALREKMHPKKQLRAKRKKAVA